MLTESKPYFIVLLITSLQESNVSPGKPNINSVAVDKPLSQANFKESKASL